MPHEYRNPPARSEHGEVIARFAVGIEAVDDGIGSVLIADHGDGFRVFVNAGMLPDGSDFIDFSASRANCLRDAYAFALSLVAEIVADQVEA